MSVVVRHVIFKQPTTHAGGNTGNVVEVFDQKGDPVERSLGEMVDIFPCCVINGCNNCVDCGVDGFSAVDRGVDQFGRGRFALFHELGKRNGVVLLVVVH